MRTTFSLRRRSAGSPHRATLLERSVSELDAMDGRPAVATLDEYVDLAAQLRTHSSGAYPRPVSLDRMLDRSGLTPLAWSQISAYWSGMFSQEPQLAQMFADRVRGRVNQLDLEWKLSRG